MKPPPAFDAYAAGYDRHFTDSVIGRAQRKQVWRVLLPLLKNNLNILEVNCGTGEDAVQLAKLGHNVLATDQSGAMIRVAKAKTGAAPPLPGLQFRQAAFQELPMVLNEKHFDLAFSNFGGLNCISPTENRRLAAHFHSFLQPNGLLFLVLMSRHCWWEQLYFSLKGERKKAVRRQSPEAVKTQIGQHELNVWYYSPGEILKLYAPWFKQESLHPIGLFTPPSYLEPLFAHRPGWIAILEKMDTLLDISYLADRADHFAIILKKTD